MDHDASLAEIQKAWHGSLRSYLVGFIASLVLTAIAFYIVAYKSLTGCALVFTLAGLALAQAIFQLLFFLHIANERHPRWKLVMFFFMVMVLMILVLGSLWIMYDLNDRVMSDMRMP